MYRTSLQFVAILIILFAPSLLLGDTKVFSESFYYTPYAKVLSTYVDRDALVDYQSLKDHPENLNAFLKRIASKTPESFSILSKEQEIAFWLNVYNACTLKSIIDHYPIKPSLIRNLVYPKVSIRQIPGVFTDLRYSIMGRELSLDDIEHEILRKEFKEPRIHLALVCAARGCPPLRREPYEGALLSEQFSDQAKVYLYDYKNFLVSEDEVQVSKIFKWFQEDFELPKAASPPYLSHLTKTQQGILRFLEPYLNPVHQELIKKKALKLSFLDYDWTLNDQKVGR